jgi:hypothetical protein
VAGDAAAAAAKEGGGGSPPGLGAGTAARPRSGHAHAPATLLRNFRWPTEPQPATEPPPISSCRVVFFMKAIFQAENISKK